MSLSDILMITATALSPLIAVQVSGWLNDRTEIRKRKLHVFRTLMATRAYTTSAEHVQALNSIDLEFSSKRRNEKNVLDKWQQYLDHLGNTNLDLSIWASKRVELFVELLYVMGQTLGYDFNKTQIKNATYSPNVHGRIESEQERLRQFTIELLDGKRSLPMHLTDVPQPIVQNSK